MAGGDAFTAGGEAFMAGGEAFMAGGEAGVGAGSGSVLERAGVRSSAMRPPRALVGARAAARASRGPRAALHDFNALPP
jgi:hypothetical protein